MRVLLLHQANIYIILCSKTILSNTMKGSQQGSQVAKNKILLNGLLHLFEQKKK